MAQKNKSIQRFKSGFSGATIQELHYLQGQLLDLMLEFDALCRKHGIEYYLDGGSVIGAVRHRGFVPWDDDIDVLMKHKEFEKLLRVIDDELAERPNRLLSFMGREAQHHRTFARYVRTDVPHIIRSTLVEATYDPGIFIDIFILDSAPADQLENYTNYLEKAEDWYHKRIPGVVGRMSVGTYRVMVMLEKILGPQWVEERYVRRLTRWADETPDYWIPRNGYNYAVYEGDVFEEPKYMPFEGHMLPVPTLPEKYLRGHYGAQWYMMPPPEEREFTHYTFTSDRHATQEMLEGYEGLKDVDLVRKRKEAEHIHRVKRHKHFLRRSNILSRMRAHVIGIEAEQVDADEIARLDAEGRYVELLSAIAPLLSRMRALVRQSKTEIPTARLSQSLSGPLLRALVHEGRTDEARKMIAFVADPDAATAALIRDATELDVCMQDGERERAEQLVDELLRDYPDCVPVLEAELRLHPSEHSSADIAAKEAALTGRVSNLDALSLHRAHALRREGHEQQAAAIYRRIVARGSNGLHVLEAADSLGEAVPEPLPVDTDATVAEASQSEALDAYEPDAVQRVQLRMLGEIEAMCQAHGIRYTLVGPAAIDYLRNGRLTEAYYDFTLAMTAKNFDRFQEVVQAELPADRGLEGQFNNPLFPYREIWYFDRGTLHFRPRAAKFDSSSVRIKIVPFKPGLRGNNATRWRDTSLYQLVERLKVTASRSPRAFRWLTAPIFRVQKEFTRRDWARYQNISAMPNVGFFYHSGYINALFGLRDTLIDQTEVVQLSGVGVQMARELLEYPTRVVPRFDEVWLKPFSDPAAVVSTSVSFDEFRRHFSRRELAAVHRAEAKHLASLRKSRQYDQKWYSYENYILRTALHIHKVKLREVYAGAGDEIAALAARGDFGALAERIEEYDALFLYFYSRNLLLRFDDQIFTALMALLRHRGEGNVAKRAEEWKALEQEKRTP